jgi:hypothetical protein
LGVSSRVRLVGGGVDNRDMSCGRVCFIPKSQDLAVATSLPWRRGRIYTGFAIEIGVREQVVLPRARDSRSFPPRFTTTRPLAQHIGQRLPLQCVTDKDLENAFQHAPSNDGLAARPMAQCTCSSCPQLPSLAIDKASEQTRSKRH